MNPILGLITVASCASQTLAGLIQEQRSICSPPSFRLCGCLTLPMSSDRTFLTFDFLCLNRLRIGIEKLLLTAVKTITSLHYIFVCVLSCRPSHRDREASLDRRDGSASSLSLLSYNFHQQCRPLPYFRQFEVHISLERYLRPPQIHGFRSLQPGQVT